MSKIYLRPKDLCARWDGVVTPGTLINWRVQGKGPRYSKIGRNVIYALEDIKTYEAAQSFSSRAEEIQNTRDQTATKPFSVVD
jgi:hypothetical protein